MVIISGIAANLVAMPNSSKIEHKTSEKTVSANDPEAPTPIGSPNCIGSPANKALNLPTPCVNINTPTVIRNSNNAMLTFWLLVPGAKNCLIIHRIF